MRQHLSILSAFLLSQFSLVSCGSITNKSPEPRIYKIEFARCSSYGPTPFEAFSIDSSRLIQYHGVAFVEKYGYFKGEIAGTDWEKLESRCLTLLDFKSDTCWNLQDAQALQLIIYSTKGVQHFYGESECLPDSLVQFCQMLMKLPEQVSLTETSSFSIETSLEKSYEGLPRDPNKEVP